MKKPGWLDKQLKQAAASVQTWPDWMRGENDQQKSSEASNDKPPAPNKNGNAKGCKDQTASPGESDQK
jgi:hypothetical protein